MRISGSFFFLVGMLLVARVPALAQTVGLDSLLWKAYESQDSADYYFEKSLPLVHTTEDSSLYFYFRFYKEMQIGNRDSALSYSEITVPLLHRLNSRVRLRNIYGDISNIWRWKGEYEKSITYLQNAVELAEALNDTLSLCTHLTGLSLVYHDFEHYDTGVQFGKQAVALLKGKEAEYLGAFTYANNAIAINFDDWGMPDSALAYHFINAKYVDNSPDSANYGFVYNNIGNTLLKQEKYEQAEGYIQKATRLHLLMVAQTPERASHYAYSLAVTNTNLAIIARHTGRYDQAREYLKKAEYYVEKSGNIEKKRELLTEQVSYYKTIGELDKALQSYEELSAVQDSVFNEQRAEAIADMEAKYQVERSERKVLELQNLVIQKDLEVQRRNTYMFGSLGLALLLGLIGYLFYNQQRLKARQLRKESELQKSLAIIETQNRLQEQRLHISRDLHDNIGSHLTLIISSLDNLKYGFKEMPQKLDDKITEISRFTGEMIGELRDTIWAMNKSSISFEDLHGRISNFIEKARDTAGNIRFDFEIDDRVDPEHFFPSAQGMNIYRIIQEAVHNALKHSRARTITVRVAQEGAQYKIEIEDDGIGFEQAEVEYGNGIESMKKRAAEMGARLIIKSAAGKGSLITLI